MDLKGTLARMFVDLADDSAAAAQLGVTSSKGYAVLGAEHDAAGYLVTACVHVPTLIDKIEEALQQARTEYERLVRETLTNRPLPTELQMPGRVNELTLYHRTGGSRSYIGRCNSSTVDEYGTQHCLLPARHEPLECSLIQIDEAAGKFVCGELHPEMTTYCRLRHPHRPERHQGWTPGGPILEGGRVEW
jgi:hypothetical protein